MATTTKTNATKLDSNTIRVRMYRVGFGDCFLISLPRGDNHPDGDGHQHILVDCGVHARGNIDMMDQAVDHIGTTTNNKLAVVIATHSHQDHISGFGDKFSSFEIEEVWLPWCEDPNDKKAAKLQKKHAALADNLEHHFAAQLRVSNRTSASRGAAMSAVANLVQNKKAMRLLRTGFGVNAKVRYFEAGNSFKSPAGIDGLSVDVLGPPRDPQFLSKMDPPEGQRYLRLDGNSVESVNELEPFQNKWRLKPNDPRLKGIRLSKVEQKKIRSDLADASLDGLAFALDKAKNNTSLVTLLAFRGQHLLLPGDAQWGNWKSWLDKDNAADILASVTFLKVAHHGSHNATPKNALERMAEGNFAAMVSTQNVPWDSIPRKPLMKRLAEQTKNRVVRSDSLALKDRPKAPKGPVIAKLPPGFREGDFWYDYLIKL